MKVFKDTFTVRHVWFTKSIYELLEHEILDNSGSILII